MATRNTYKGKSSVKKSNSSTNVDRRAPKEKTHLRTQATIRRLRMYSNKPIRDAKGKIVVAADFQSTDVPVARIMPDRRWFGNTRVVGQSELTAFRDEIDRARSDPYTVLVRQSKVPFGLLSDPKRQAKMNLLTSESFEETFGPKRQRKRPKIAVSDVNQLLETVQDKESKYDETKDSAYQALIDESYRDLKREDIFSKGQSKRIWGELYKVLDSSDVIVQVLDARDPMGTRSRHVENHLKKSARHKHLIFVLNKCDLVPTWATARWVKVLSREHPTLAFHASITNPFGKGSLIQLLRQFAHLHSDRAQITVGFIGFPNVGKSSIINTLRKKQVCTVAPIPGETKVWQYVALMRRIFLIDSPGIVYPAGDSETDLILKGVVRVERVEDLTIHIDEMLRRVRKDHIARQYGISQWNNAEDLLEKLARQTGRLLGGGEPDLNSVAKSILRDWQRGRLPHFVMPPFEDDEAQTAKQQAEEAREAEAQRRIELEKQMPGVPVHIADDDIGQALERRMLRDTEKYATTKKSADEKKAKKKANTEKWKGGGEGRGKGKGWKLRQDSEMQTDEKEEIEFKNDDIEENNELFDKLQIPSQNISELKVCQFYADDEEPTNANFVAKQTTIKANDADDNDEAGIDWDMVYRDYEGENVDRPVADWGAEGPPIALVQKQNKNKRRKNSKASGNDVVLSQKKAQKSKKSPKKDAKLALNEDLHLDVNEPTPKPQKNKRKRKNIETDDDNDDNNDNDNNDDDNNDNVVEEGKGRKRKLSNDGQNDESAQKIAKANTAEKLKQLLKKRQIKEKQKKLNSKPKTKKKTVDETRANERKLLGRTGQEAIVKEPRQTTGKMKVGQHYYAHVNVKNRRRRNDKHPGRQRN